MDRSLFCFPGTGFADIAGFVTGNGDNPTEYQQRDY
jgi:hypothetical protein